MLTEEQIKSLKPGDPIVIHTTFDHFDSEGDLHFKAPLFSNSDNIDYICPECVSLPTDSQSSTVNSQSKHDSTRLFKKGDRAQVVERNGRTPTCFPVGRIKVGDIVTVAENEAGDMFIKVLTEDGHEMMVPWFMLELIALVEELEPYSVHEESMHNRWNVIKDKYVHGIHAMFPYKNIGNSDLMSREEAKARADEYSARLNAEWRKEQENNQ